MSNTVNDPSFEHHRNHCTELQADEVGRCRSRHFAIYTAVDPANNVHRPMPPQHPALLGEEEFRKLIAGIDLETAAVQWACRSLPLPNAYPDLYCFVFLSRQHMGSPQSGQAINSRPERHNFESAIHTPLRVEKGRRH